MEQLPITPRKVIPIEKLTNQNVLLWRYFVKHLKEGRLQEYLDEMLPELSEFCNYVREFMEQMGNTDLESWEAESQKLILLQLFEMEELFDLSDEAGRVNLRHLITEVLVSKRVHVDDIWQDILINLVKSMERIIPSVDERLTALTLVISELRMPTEQRTQPDQITEDESDEMRLKVICNIQFVHRKFCWCENLICYILFSVFYRLEIAIESETERSDSRAGPSSSGKEFW